MPRPATYAIAHPKIWSLLVAPARIEMIEAMRLLAPCSIAEIASVLDRPADTLYRHMQKLVSAGLVVQHGMRRSSRRVEQVFDLVADDFTFGFKDGSAKSANKAFLQAAQSFLKSTSRAVRDSAASERLIASQDVGGNLILSYELGWLTPAAFREVNALTKRVKALMDQGKHAREGSLHLSLCVVTPVTRRRSAKAVSTTNVRDLGAGKKRALSRDAAPSHKGSTVAGAKRAPSKRAKT